MGVIGIHTLILISHHYFTRDKKENCKVLWCSRYLFWIEHVKYRMWTGMWENTVHNYHFILNKLDFR